MKFNVKTGFLMLSLILVPSHLAASIVPVQAMQKLARRQTLTADEKRSLGQVVGAIASGLIVVGAGVAGVCLWYKKCFKCTSSDLQGSNRNSSDSDADSVSGDENNIPDAPPFNPNPRRLPTAVDNGNSQPRVNDQNQQPDAGLNINVNLRHVGFPPEKSRDNSGAQFNFRDYLKNHVVPNSNKKSQPTITSELQDRLQRIKSKSLRS